MADVIAVDREPVEAMIQALKEGAGKLSETYAEMQKVAKTLEEGGLRGRAGAAFVEGLNSGLAPAIARLIEKLEEEATDVYQAAIVGILGEADPEAEKILRS